MRNFKEHLFLQTSVSRIGSEFEISQNSEENTCARALDAGRRPVTLQALLRRDSDTGVFRDVYRGVLLPVNRYGIPNSYPKLIKN